MWSQIWFEVAGLSENPFRGTYSIVYACISSTEIVLQIWLFVGCNLHNYFLLSYNLCLWEFVTVYLLELEFVMVYLLKSNFIYKELMFLLTKQMWIYRHDHMVVTIGWTLYTLPSKSLFWNFYCSTWFSICVIICN